MTDKERKEAEQLAESYFGEDGPGFIGTATFIAGYEAACEAKRVELDAMRIAANDKVRRSIFRMLDNTLNERLEIERARSAKLINDLYELLSVLGKISPAGLALSRMIVEYEASK